MEAWKVLKLVVDQAKESLRDSPRLASRWWGGKTMLEQTDSLHDLVQKVDQ
jgi:hypothetical protein